VISGYDEFEKSMGIDAAEKARLEYMCAETGRLMLKCAVLGIGVGQNGVIPEDEGAITALANGIVSRVMLENLQEVVAGSSAAIEGFIQAALNDDDVPKQIKDAICNGVKKKT